jgi:hypothetical protein
LFCNATASNNSQWQSISQSMHYCRLRSSFIQWGKIRSADVIAPWTAG